MLIRRSFLFILCLLALIACSSEPQTKQVLPQTPKSNAQIDQQILSLIRSQDFGTLDMMLVEIENDYEKDYRKERQVDIAFDTFYRASADLDALLGSWIKAKPNSYAAYLARGIYYTRVGWLKRGDKFIDKTTKQQLDWMAYYFQKALKDFDHARLINKKTVHPLCYEIEILMNFGQKEQIRKLYEEALQINPMSLTVRWYYITTVLPRWGGSIPAIEKEVESARPFYERNPALKILDGRVAAELGDKAFFSGDYANAVKPYSDALKYGNHWYYNKQRGDTYYYLGQNERSNKDLNVALELRPNSDRVLLLLASNLYQNDQYKEAIPFLSKVIDINPYDDYSLDTRGDSYFRLGELDLALSDFEKAVALNPKNSKYLADRERVRQVMGVTH